MTTESEITATLTGIFRDMLDDDTLVLTPELTADDVAEWDSLNHIGIIVATEKKFGIKFKTAEIEELKNVGEFHPSDRREACQRRALARMLFNSPEFLFLFLPLALFGFYAIARRNWHWANGWLALASLFFYGWWNIHFLPVLLISILVNYALATAILRCNGRDRLANAMLAIGILLNLAALFTFKYLAAALSFSGIAVSAPIPDFLLVLPLGISFFTFTQIGFLVDCRQGMARERSFIRYVVFVTFFPHLIAGPILHHREIMPQLSDEKNYRLDWRNIAAGSSLFIIGFAKKVLVADTIAGIVAPGFDNVIKIGIYDAWVTAIAYSLQLYFDFSGYSDMAIGLAQMFGIRFPLNFNSPYKSASIIEFWQRWHMTLSRYLNLYLYNPIALLVSRSRDARGLSVSRRATGTPGGFTSMVFLPAMVTMALAGVWHGAGSQFLIFGVLHGIYLVINHAWRIFGPKHHAMSPPRPAIRQRAITMLKILATYIAVVISLVFFRSASTAQALGLLCDMAGLNDAASDTPLSTYKMLAALLGVIWFFPNSQQIMEMRWQPNWRWAVGMGFAFGWALAIMFLGDRTEFLYFQF